MQSAKIGQVPYNTREVLGKNLRRLIEEAGYRTVELFCHENGFEKAWVGKVISGKVDAKISSVARLAHALEASIDDFYPMKPRSKTKKP